MAKRLLKLLVSLVYFLGQQVIFLASRIVGIRRARLVTLTYHQVTAKNLGRFERQMAMVRNCGTPVFAGFTSPNSSGRFIAITFDDFLAEAVANAGQLLGQLKLPSTWFVVSGCLGGKVNWIRNTQRANDQASIGSANDLANLDKSLFQIASHTASHAKLTALFRDAACAELKESQAVLSEIWREPLASVSFPYGEYNPEIVKLCENAGYRFAFANLPVWRCCSRRGLLRGRVPAEPGDWPIEFWLKIRGGYNWQAVSGFLRYECLARFRGRNPAVATEKDLEVIKP